MLDPATFNTLRQFRAEVYDRFGARRDALFELLDAATVAGLVPSLAYLSLPAVHRRGWGSLYDALAAGAWSACLRARGVAFPVVRKGLSIQELGDLLERPYNATLATYRRDGSVLLSPVWHEWRHGGFSIITIPTDVKVRHIEREAKAVVVVSDNDFPFRGIELSCSPIIVRDFQFGQDTLQRIATRYLGAERAQVYLSVTESVVVIRMEPGELRTWDFADDAEGFGFGSTQA